MIQCFFVLFWIVHAQLFLFFFKSYPNHLAPHMSAKMILQMLFQVSSLVPVLCTPPTSRRSINTSFDPHFLLTLQSCLWVLSFLSCFNPLVCLTLLSPCCFPSSKPLPPPLPAWQTVGTLFVPVAGTVYACKGLYLTFYCNNIPRQVDEHSRGQHCVSWLLKTVEIKRDH